LILIFLSITFGEIVEEKLIFVTDSYLFDGAGTFRLILEPSSVLRSLDVVTRDQLKFLK